MARPYYGVFFDGYGKEVSPDLISKHWTFEGAMRAFKRRNPHLFRKSLYSNAYSNTGTFDKILYVDENGEFNRYSDLVD